MIPLLVLVLIVLVVFHAQAARRLASTSPAPGNAVSLHEIETARVGCVSTEVLALACLVVLLLTTRTAPLWGRLGVASLVVGAIVYPWPAAPTGERATPALLRWLGTLLSPRPRATRNEAPSSGTIDPLDEQVLVRRMLQFAEKESSEVMIPRSEIIAVEKGSGIAALVELLEEHRHSRYPVYEGNIDHVIGYVSVFDLFKIPLDEASFDSVIKPIVIVPQGKRAAELLDELSSRRENCALVIDEFGGTAGLVTSEDLVEPIIGEIMDEHEEEWTAVRRVGRDAFVCDATISRSQLREATGYSLPEGDYETLAGFLLEEFGRIPVKGDTVTRESATFEVVRASRQRIELVQVRLRRSVVHR
jgi:CBS domain containing-hemolysin-like protein